MPKAKRYTEKTVRDADSGAGAATGMPVANTTRFPCRVWSARPSASTMAYRRNPTASQGCTIPRGGHKRVDPGPSPRYGKEYHARRSSPMADRARQQFARDRTRSPRP